MHLIGTYILLFFIYAFIGWIGEVCLALVIEKKFSVNTLLNLM